MRTPAKKRRAFEAHTQFNGREPARLRRVNLDTSTPLLELGRCPEIHYLSGKEGKGVRHYYHEVRRPGKLYAHPDGKYFLLLGGSTRVREWLENPPSQLSRSNIMRAIEVIADDMEKRGARKVLGHVTDLRGYISHVAWDIQTGRGKRLGHR